MSLRILNFFIVGMFLNLHALTTWTESSYEALQDLKEHFHEEFLRAPSDGERQRYQYLVMTLSQVQPMTASGYFEISRGTLTSMLSVRNESDIILVREQY